MPENPSMQSPTHNTATGEALVPVTPDDEADLLVAARGLRCKPLTGVAGTLRFTALNGTVCNTEINVGEFIPVGARRVHASGTTATGLEALI